MAFENIDAAVVKLSGLPVIRSWLRISKNLSAKNVTVVAGGVAFYAFLSIFPAIASVLMIWGFFTDVSDLNPIFTFPPRHSAWPCLPAHLKTNADHCRAKCGGICPRGSGLVNGRLLERV